MKKYLLILLITLYFNHSGQSQISVLFVNDNGIQPSNTTTLLNYLNLSGYTYEVFDAVANSRSPYYSEMSNYDLVLWYISSDGVGRYFWNGTDTDNMVLADYLDNGGLLCVMGTDFLYDRYSTPYNFSQGEFAHDYLGIGEYFAQSYADDGFLGVEQLELMAGNEILGLNPVRWVFPTLWYVDACLPATGAVPVYRMGPPAYVFSNYFAGIANRQNGLNTLSFFFDPVHIDTQEHAVALFTGIRSYFTTVGVEIRQQVSPKETITVFPNPAADKILISLPAVKPETGYFSISDIFGRIVKISEPDHRSINQVEIDISEFPKGFYVIRTKDGKTGTFVKK